ncbi:molybdopterin oxidoreductase family protein [Enterococcus sp. AZ109]|uniref:molybdopterin oxidoreductase family protein n=1 Tax=Enterococcus sp. AZ109 TaxID=2774634 RepID=UPI003F287F25
MKKVQSTCNYCALACNLDFYVEDNQITKILPTKDYPVNQGFSCIKGLMLHRQQQQFKPVSLPRVKNADGSFSHVKWAQAFDQTAEKLKEIIAKHGPESVAGISTGQLMLEDMALFGHIMRTYLKGNVDGNTRLCMATSVVAHKQSFGFDAPPYTLKDVEQSDTIILIGANPVVAHPVFWGRIRKNQLPNKKVVVIDPRFSETAKQADKHYQLKAKADLTLFYILANLLMEKGWIDQSYIDNYTEGFETFAQFLKDYPLERAEETGLSQEAILELAQLIHDGEKVSFWWTMGVNQSYEAVRTAQSIINLALMTGNIGRPGTGANSLTGQCNAMGSRLFSNTTGLYGGGDYDNPLRRKAVSEALKIEEEWLPTKPTLPYNVIIEKINSGEIKALWVVATNPYHSWTNSETFKTAMEKLDLLIVQDLYDDTGTSSNCDVFFPVVAGTKKEGTVINTERRLSAMRPALEKEPNEMTDYEVMYQMGKALGMGELLNGWETPKAAFELMKKCTEKMPCDITGVEYDGLTGSKGIQWPFSATDTLKEDERRLFEDHLYYTPSKKAQFIFETPRENPLALSSEFPLLLNTGRGTVGQWHTQSRTREIPEVYDAVERNAYIMVHPENAKELKVKNKELVDVTSINGMTKQLEIKISPFVSYDEVYAPMHYVEVNFLTPSIYDSYSKEPSYKSTPVRISKRGK